MSLKRQASLARTGKGKRHASLTEHTRNTRSARTNPPAPLTFQNESSTSNAQRSPTTRTLTVRNPDSPSMTRLEIAFARQTITIQNVGYATHTAIKHKISDRGIADDSNLRASRYISRSAWPTPPVSPSDFKPISPKTPDSISSEISRRERVESHLASKDLDTLLDIDKATHNLFDQLASLRFWWNENRNTWRQITAEISSLVEGVDAIAIRKEDLQDQADRATEREDVRAKEREVERLESESVRLNAELEKRMKLLSESESEMVITTSLFKDLKAATRELQLQSHVLRRDAWQEVEFITGCKNKVSQEDVTSAPWFKTRGFKWWLGEAASYFQNRIEETEAHIADARDELQELDALRKYYQIEIGKNQRDRERFISDSDSRIKHLTGCKLKYSVTSTRRFESELEKDLQARSIQETTSEAALQEIQTNLKAIEEQCKWALTNLADLQRRTKIKTAGLALVQSTLSVGAKNMDAQYIFNFVGVQVKRDQQVKELSKILSDSEASSSGPKGIVKLLTAHFRKFSDHGEKIPRFLAAVDPPRNQWNDLAYATLAANNEVLDFGELILDARGILRADTRDMYEGKIGEKKAYVVPFGQDWGVIKTWEEARKILREKESDLNGNWLELGEILRQFYLSPDVAHVFSSRVDISKEHFLKLTNSLLVNKYTPLVIEAFLFYSTNIDHLFTYSQETGKVSSVEHGWELVQEMPIGGDIRLIALVNLAPLKATQLEELIVKYQKQIELAGPERNMSEKDLLGRINSFWPQKELSLKELQGILGFWSHCGKMFLYTNARSHPQNQLLHRIDNGWPLPVGDSTYEPLPFTPSSNRIYRGIAKMVIHDNTIPIFAAAFDANEFPSEAELYERIDGMLFVRRGKKGERVRSPVSRYDWHCFLRWCEVKGRLFRFFRDGRVQFLDVGWNWNDEGLDVDA